MTRITDAGRQRVLLCAIAAAALACNLQVGAPAAVPADPTGTATPSPPAPPEATAVPSLTATLRLTASPTSQATATQGPPPVITVSAVGGRLNVRRGPGPEYDTVGALLDGQSRTASARNADGTWLLISGPDPSTSLGWVITTTKYTSVSGDAVGLPWVTVAPAAPAYIRNCTPHEMLVNPVGVLLLNRNSAPENRLQFFPGEYSATDQTSGTDVASMTVFEGRTIDIRKDSLGTSYTCP